MKSTQHRLKTFSVRLLPNLLLLACLAIFLAAFSTPAKAANLVTNGSFENVTSNVNSPGAYFCQAGATCTSNVSGWMSVCRSNSCGNGTTPTSILYAGTNGSGFNGGIGLYSAADSPDGGKYVAADADSAYNTAIFQIINGLTIGGKYTLTFYQAGAQQKGQSQATTDQWKVSFGTQAEITAGTAATQLSQTINTPSQGFAPWSLQTMLFTATSSSEVLSFLATSPSGLPPVALLDGVSLTTATPEPSTFVLALASLGGFGMYIRRRRSTRS